MLVRSLFVVSALCLVNASVVNVNIYDVDDISALDSDVQLQRCDILACGRSCRAQGYSGGMCIGDRCKCNNYAQLFTAASFSNDEAAAAKAAGDCNLNACDQLCRRLGFPGGACVNGKCDCDNFREAAVSFSNDEAAAVKATGDCNLNACEQLCRRLGFPGGACVNGKCDCDNFRAEEVRIIPVMNDNSISENINKNLYEVDDGKPSDKPMNPLEAAKLGLCYNNECNRYCRRLNHMGGYCVGLSCYCY